MKTRIACALLLLLGCVVPAWGANAPEPTPASEAAAPGLPWVKAQAVLDELNTDLSKGSGYAAIRAHLRDLEEALDGADAAIAATTGDKNVSYVLTDGLADTLFALVAASAAHEKTGIKDNRKVVAVNNPYPQIALYLGGYYNEIQRFDDALRVLDRGLKLVPTQGLSFGEHRPYLFAERAIALGSLKRLDEALASYDEGLKATKDDDAQLKARMQRGRGYVLTEMGRLDEAEAAYHESLKLEPDNPLAKRELEYIAKLRLGGKTAPTEIITPKPPPAPLDSQPAIQPTTEK